MSCRRLREPPKAADALTGMAGPEAGIHDGVRAALGQIYHLDLRKGARPPIRGVPTEDRSIGRRVRHIFSRAIERHQPPAEEKRPVGLLGRQRLADPVEQPG
jgi:hypothetical protein